VAIVARRRAVWVCRDARVNGPTRPRWRGASGAAAVLGEPAEKPGAADNYRRVMIEIHREPAGSRFLFWTSYYGGDPLERDKLRWVKYEIPGYANGAYTLHEESKPSGLRRYDTEARSRGIYPAGTYFGAGVWRESEGAYRNYHRGGDYGDPITTAQATEIMIGMGYSADLLTTDPVR
jgi:hypothetical protein